MSRNILLILLNIVWIIGWMIMIPGIFSIYITSCGGINCMIDALNYDCNKCITVLIGSCIATLISLILAISLPVYTFIRLLNHNIQN